MKTVIAILIATALHAAPPSVQVPPALKDFLQAQAPTGSASRSADYQVAFKSFHLGKPRGVFQKSGVMHIGTTDKGDVWVRAPQQPHEFQIGETVSPPEGQRWFKHLCEPSRVAPWADPGAFLSDLVNKLQLKGIENPLEGVGEPGNQILVYRLEAPRPVAKFWMFKAKAGEARLQVRKDGAPVSLEVVQAYEGRLSPHFGRYLLNRREAWIFSVGAGQVHTTKYRLFLRRQDWKESVEADVEMAVGALQ